MNDKAIEIAKNVYQACQFQRQSVAVDIIADIIRPYLAPQQFPRQPLGDGGWTILFRFLLLVQESIPDDEIKWAIGLEAIEGVLLAIEKLSEGFTEAKLQPRKPYGAIGISVGGKP
jgi:hypothetical protein